MSWFDKNDTPLHLAEDPDWIIEPWDDQDWKAFLVYVLIVLALWAAWNWYQGHGREIIPGQIDGGSKEQILRWYWVDPPSSDCAPRRGVITIQPGQDK